MPPSHDKWILNPPEDAQFTTELNGKVGIIFLKGDHAAVYQNLFMQLQNYIAQAMSRQNGGPPLQPPAQVAPHIQAKGPSVIGRLASAEQPRPTSNPQDRPQVPPVAVSQEHPAPISAAAVKRDPNGDFAKVHAGPPGAHPQPQPLHPAAVHPAAVHPAAATAAAAAAVGPHAIPTSAAPTVALIRENAALKEEVATLKVTLSQVESTVEAGVQRLSAIVETYANATSQRIKDLEGLVAKVATPSENVAPVQPA